MGDPTTRQPDRWNLGLFVALFLIVGITAAAAFNRTSALAGYDAVADWLVTQSAVSGGDPFAPVESLAEEHRIELGRFVGVEASPHPRLPGFFLLLAPFVSFGPTLVYVLVLFLSVVAACFVLSWCVRQAGGTTAARAVAMIMALSAPVIGTLQFGTWSLVLAALLVLVVNGERSNGSGVVSGVALGLAMTLKAFPALLLIPLLLWKRLRTSSIAVGVFSLLNIGALLTFDIELSEVLGGLAGASNAWMGFIGNSSLSSLLFSLGAPTTIASVAPPLVAVGLAAWLATRDDDQVLLLAFGVVIAVVASPLSWGHYQALIIPSMAVLWSRRRAGATDALVVCWLVVWIVGVPLGAHVLAPTQFHMLVVAGAALPVVAFAFVSRSGANDEDVESDLRPPFNPISEIEKR